MTPRGYWLNYLNIPAGARLHAAWEAKPERSCARPSCPHSTGWRPTAPQSQAPTQASADLTQDYAELTPSSGMQRQGRCSTRVHHSLPWCVFSRMMPNSGLTAPQPFHVLGSCPANVHGPIAATDHGPMSLPSQPGHLAPHLCRFAGPF